MTARAAVGLGSNLGDRTDHLTAGVRALARAGDLVAVSSLYETDPVGGPDQGPYLNAVAVVDTRHSARELLDRLLDTERATGRQRRERWGPRTLDLDILWFGGAEIDQPGLVVPHPHLTERRFVLEPLVEVWSELVIDGVSVRALAERVDDQRVAIVAAPSWWLSRSRGHPA